MKPYTGILGFFSLGYPVIEEVVFIWPWHGFRHLGQERKLKV